MHNFLIHEYYLLENWTTILKGASEVDYTYLGLCSCGWDYH